MARDGMALVKAAVAATAAAVVAKSRRDNDESSDDESAEASAEASAKRGVEARSDTRGVRDGEVKALAVERRRPAPRRLLRIAMVFTCFE